MDFKQSPFRSGWWGTSLDNVGLGDQRPDVGTYGLYEQGGLPPLPVCLDGELGWLADAPRHEQHIGLEQAAEVAEALPRLLDACHGAGVSLPHSFVKFMDAPDLQARVRSNTDCFLSLSEAPVPSPIGDGKLIRFLADSQGCIFWYLYIPAGSSDHAVVSSPDFYDPDGELWEGEEAPDPDALVFNAESFEGFLCRFWIENELWLSEYEGTPMNEICRRYLELYRGSPASELGA
jgi:hypothetical protein